MYEHKEGHKHEVITGRLEDAIVNLFRKHNQRLLNQLVYNIDEQLTYS